MPKRADGATRPVTVTSKPHTDTRLRKLIDRFVPGWSFKQALFIFAHPDDETMMTKTIATLLARGVQVRVIYLTQSNGGTAFTSQSGIQRRRSPRRARRHCFRSATARCASRNPSDS